MKIAEQIISPKKVVTETVLHDNKKYFRITFPGKKYNGLQKQDKIEWRRAKTNHQVKSDEHKNLEAVYLKKFSKPAISPDHHFAGRNVISSGSTMFDFFVPVRKVDIEEEKERKALEKEVRKLLASNEGLLATVKYVKEKTGLGLKEAKDFVENIIEQSKKQVGVSSRGIGNKK